MTFPSSFSLALSAAVEQLLVQALADLAKGVVPPPGFASSLPTLAPLCRKHGFTLTAYRVNASALLFRFEESKDLLALNFSFKKGAKALPVSDWIPVEVPIWYIRYEQNGKKAEAGPFYEHEKEERLAYVRSLLEVSRVALVHRNLRVGNDWEPRALLGAQSSLPSLSTAVDITKD